MSNPGSIDDGVLANAGVSGNSGQDRRTFDFVKYQCFEELIKLLTQAQKFTWK